MKRLLLLLLLLSLGLNIGLFAALDRAGRRADEVLALGIAGPQGPGRFLPPEKREAFLAERHRIWRQMSTEDRDRLDALRHRTRDSGAPLRAELDSTRLALREAMRAPVLDDAAIAGLMRRMSAAQARLDSTVAAALLDEFRDMGPAERQRFLKMMPWEREGRGHRAGGGEPR